MSDKHKYIELVPSTVLTTLRGEDGNNYIEFGTHLRIVNEVYDRLNKQGHETARILNLCDEKDAEIEKYKKSFESAKCERDKAVCEYQNEIDRLTAENAELHCQIQAMNMYPDESIREPIKMADWIVHHFKQGEEYAIYERDANGKLHYAEIDGEKVPVQTGEYGKHREVREIADYLLAYCKYHTEE